MGGLNILINGCPSSPKKTAWCVIIYGFSGGSANAVWKRRVWNRWGTGTLDTGLESLSLFFYEPTRGYKTTFGPSFYLGVLLHRPPPPPPLRPTPHSSLPLTPSSPWEGKWPLHIVGSMFTANDQVKICLFSPVCYNSFNALLNHELKREAYADLLLQYPLCATVIASLFSQESFSNSQVLLYVFPLLPQTKPLDWGQEFLAHAHWAVPLLVTMHLAFEGHFMRAQGVVGLSEKRNIAAW